MQQYLKWCSKILWSKKYIQMYFILPGILITVLSPLYLYTCTKICFDVLILFCIWFYQKLRYTCIYLQYISRFVFIYSIYIYLGLESILRKLFWESFCCSFELGPPYCLAFVTSQHLICHIWPSLYLLFVSVDVHL